VVLAVVQLYVQAQLQFGCKNFVVPSQFVQLTVPDIVQLPQFLLPQLQLEVQLPLAQLPAVLFA
jgi:hypothetical protein